MQKIIVAMSGGVDSAAALITCIREGYEVTGLTLKLFHDDRSDAAMHDARVICRELNVPHIVIDAADRFENQVIDGFCEYYRQGKTPSPCLQCNPMFKWNIILNSRAADSSTLLATGHYARIAAYRGKPCIRRGRFMDQSYFLHRLESHQIERTLFPVGDLTKESARTMVANAGLHVADRPDSQEVCFIDGKYSDFLDKHMDSVPPPGVIMDLSRAERGRHKGIHHYTVGQRSGLGIAAPRPLYVVKIDAVNNRLIVGEKEAVFQSSFRAENIVWSAIDPPIAPFECRVQVRYRHRPVRCRITPISPSTAHVILTDPPGAVIVTGQGAAFYHDDLVLGGGEIADD